MLTRTFATAGLLAIFLIGGAGAGPLVVASTPQVLQAGEVLHGNFVQERTLAGFAKPLKTGGVFALIPGRGLIWHAKTPFENVTVIQPEGILVRTNGQETMRLPADKLPGLSHLYDVLSGAVSGNTNALRHDFAVQGLKPVTGWRFTLTPLHPRTPAMSQLKTLTVSGHQFVETIEIDKGGGDSDRLTFLEQVVTKAAPTAEESALLGALHK